MKKIHLPVYFYAVTAMLFWGMSFIWSSVLLKYYEPVTIIFVRLVISSALLFTFFHLSGQKARVKKKDYLLIFLSALFNPFLYFLGENYGLKYSTPTISAVIIAMIPVFSPVIAYLSFREKLTPINFVGIAVSFCGVIMMLVNGSLSLTADVRGVAFLFGAVFAALLYSVMLRRLTATYSAVWLVAAQNLIGVLLFLPLFMLNEYKTAIAVPITREIISSMLLLAVLASSVAFVFFAYSVKLLGISKTNIFSNLIPVFTAVFSYFLLSEYFSLQKIAGITLVIAGVYLSERTRKRS
ncbi:MAG: DMT family transporter [Bacteroidota bacterium]